MIGRIRGRGLRASPSARFGPASAQSLNQIESAYGQNNAILDNCHVRVAFSTNDERTARRISDSLGTATEMRAMKNYAGHRLAPWLGHLMVSRQETARALLTPGEVMQLPNDEAIVMVSGAPPVRALKTRYFLDGRLSGRVVRPPGVGDAIRPEREEVIWTQVLEGRGPAGRRAGADDEGGHQRALLLEPDERAAKPALTEISPGEDLEEGDEVQQADQLQGRFRSAARQASLDPDDGIPL